MIFTDTHTHIYSKEFESDQQQMMDRALAAGVKRFFVPAIAASYTEAMYDIEMKYPDKVFLMMGLHPTHVDENYVAELDHCIQELKKRSAPDSVQKFYAVGEIGIDLYWDRTTLQLQQDAFCRQIRLAKEYALPIVIHCRNAFDEVFEILAQEKHNISKGIFHCFTGTLEQAEIAMDYGFHLGIGGVVTFKNGKIDRFLNQIPLQYLVLETDAPYLAPKPYRGKRNESAYIPLIANKLASIYDVPLEQIAEITTQNAIAIFGA